MGIGLVGRVVALAGTPDAVVEEAGFANIHQPHQRSLPWVHPWRQKAPRLWGGIQKKVRAHPRNRKEKDMKIKGTFKRMSQTKACGR